MNTQKSNLRTMVRSAYDLQTLRIQIGNRLCGNFKAKLGQEPSKPEADLDAEEKRLLQRVRASYNLLADYVKQNSKHPFKGDELITTEAEFYLIKNYLSIEKAEEENFSAIERVLLSDFPIYAHFLRPIRGIGPVMSAVIISEVDIHIATTVSKIWRYSGLDTGPDGKGRSRKKEHLVERTYTTKDGEQATKQSITYNPFLKTKLLGVLAPCFLRAGSPYAEIYRGYKHRLEHHATYKDVSKAHRHAMSQRYMVKMFLADLYASWRSLEGLEVRPPYQQEKLGHTHAISDQNPSVYQRADDCEKPLVS